MRRNGISQTVVCECSVVHLGLPLHVLMTVVLTGQCVLDVGHTLQLAHRVRLVSFCLPPSALLTTTTVRADTTSIRSSPGTTTTRTR